MRIRNPRLKAVGDDDARLMVQAAKGSETAYSALICRHQQVLMNFFRRLGADVHAAEDATQETFLRVFNYRLRYRPEAPFRFFLFTLARHAWVDLARKSRRWRSGKTTGVEVDQQPVPLPVAGWERLDLQEALERLPFGHRMVLVLSLYYGLRYQEISKVMKIPVGTVKSRVFHALRKLREAMTTDAAL